MILSLEELALVTGGASTSAAPPLVDDARCAAYKLETAKQRVQVGAKIATFSSAADYLSAQAAIEEPKPAFCK